MSLERTLAEIQVMAREISSRSIEAHRTGKDVNWSRVNNYSDGITHEAGIVYDSFKSAEGKKDPSVVNRYLGEFTTGLKNMADNVNGLLQTFYNPTENRVSHKDLGKIVGKAPLLDNETSMLDLFLQTHDHINGDVVKLRNRRSHGSGHDLVLVTNDGLKVVHGQTILNVADWMKYRAQSYLVMARKILETIAEKEKLSDRKSYSGSSIMRQRLGNWRKRHQKTVAIGLGSAAFVGGVLGSAYVQNKIKTDRELFEGETVRGLVMLSKMANEENWARGLDRTSYLEVVDLLQNRNANLGVEVDNYVLSMQNLNNHLRPEAKRKYETFKSGRAAFREDLLSLSKRIRLGDYNNQIEIIDKLSGLLAYERELTEEVDSLQGTLGRVRPLNSSFYLGDPMVDKN